MIYRYKNKNSPTEVREPGHLRQVDDENRLLACKRRGFGCQWFDALPGHARKKEYNGQVCCISREGEPNERRPERDRGYGAPFAEDLDYMIQAASGVQIDGLLITEQIAPRFSHVAAQNWECSVMQMDSGRELTCGAVGRMPQENPHVSG